MLGVDRVMLGTDHPFPMGDQDPVALVNSTPGLGPEEVSAITSENARRLLG
jgi:aminocarboxymuconate-semialdehyde decarboxylase